MAKSSKLHRVYRIGAGVVGTLLVAVGVLTSVGSLTYFATSGDEVLGVSGNHLLSMFSVLVGCALLLAATVGGRTASTLNVAVGTVFLVGGLLNLALLRTSANVLDVGVRNVVFSLVVGVVVLTFGLYGRLSGGLVRDDAAA